MKFSCEHEAIDAGLVEWMEAFCDARARRVVVCQLYGKDYEIGPILCSHAFTPDIDMSREQWHGLTNSMLRCAQHECDLAKRAMVYGFLLEDLDGTPIAHRSIRCTPRVPPPVFGEPA